MRITFIRPDMNAGRSGDAIEPLVFAVLAGLTPPDVRCRLYDERVEPVPFDEPADLVAMTVDTFCARRAYQIAAHYHQRGTPVVMGGHHPTLLPAEALGYATAVVIGDAEDTWPAVVADARCGALRRTYRSTLPGLEGIRFDRGIFAGKRYLPVSLVQWTRGCRFACDFCSVHAFYGQSIRKRPIPEVVADIRASGRRHVIFTDDNLFCDPDSAAKLCAALRPLGIRWSCQISLDVAAREDLVRAMRQCGCFSVTVGFESLVPATLREMNKQWVGGAGRIEELVRVFRRHGITVYGSFVFGYDYDTEAVIDRTVEFAIRSKLFLANFNPLTPTPGSPVYERLRDAGRLIGDPWWLAGGYRFGQPTFCPKLISGEQLVDGCYRARARFNSAGSILLRGLDLRANCSTPYHAGMYVAANVVTRREVFRKRGLPLGPGELPAPVYTASCSHADCPEPGCGVGTVPP